ncbi:MAG: hypothetical protein Salg2KO_22700 [Salibacteraceae bacterium]
MHAVSGGGGGNILRTVGHTQFLAMCTSLAVPQLPDEFTELTKGYGCASNHSFIIVNRAIKNCTLAEK